MKINKNLLNLAPILLLFFSYSSFAGLWEDKFNVCNTGGTPGNNKITVTVNNMKPFSSVAVGDIIGTATASAHIRCGTDHPSWPNAETMRLRSERITPQPGTVCDSNIDGVGIRMFDKDNTPIGCDEYMHSSPILFDVSFNLNNNNIDRDFIYTSVIELVKTKDKSNLSNGAYPLNPAHGTRLFFTALGSQMYNWGHYEAPSLPTVIISNCIFSEVAQVVNFNGATAEQITKGIITVPFNVTFKNCSSTSLATFFNNYAKIRFISANISADGRLKNDICATCATGVAIEVSQANGTKVDLTQKYALTSGDFTITSDTIIQKFNAKLVKTGEIKTGKIHALLIMEIISV